MTQPTSTVRPRFTTHDLRVAAVARATGAALLSIDDADPARIEFTFDLREDFHAQLLAGQVKVDGQAVIDALEALQGFVKNPRRRQR